MLNLTTLPTCLFLDPFRVGCIARRPRALDAILHQTAQRLQWTAGDNAGQVGYGIRRAGGVDDASSVYKAGGSVYRREIHAARFRIDDHHSQGGTPR